MLGTYYWYMYLLDINSLPIPGRKRRGSDTVVTTPENMSAKGGDIEANAGLSNQV